jgi:3',5'-cyclic AMP phosphodiesterase CpdA
MYKEGVSMEGKVIRIAQLSDLHITKDRNLLHPLVNQLNKENLDLVVITGDLVQEPTKELFDIAVADLNKIVHRVAVIPGEYDSSTLWTEYFGEPYKRFSLDRYIIDLVDSSFMGHKFLCGWGDHIEAESPTQAKWLLDSLQKDDCYHIIYSHHPLILNSNESALKFTVDNVRAAFSGHLHEASRFYFKYDKPKGEFPSGYICTPIDFHGLVGYNIVEIKEDDSIATAAREFGRKRTAW